MIKVILQHDQRDCGAACLAMIAAHYGLKYPLSKFRKLTKTDREGTNLYGLVDGAKQIGLHADALSGTPQDLINGIKSKEIAFPFIAHIVSDGVMLHYVVVFEQKKNGIFIVGDPARGKRHMRADGFFTVWTGYIVTFKKAENFRSGNYAKRSLLKFLVFLQGQSGKLAAVLVLSLVISGIGIAGAFVFKVVIDDLGTASSLEGSCFSRLDLILMLIIGLYLLQAVIQIIRGFLIISVSRIIDIRLSLTYYNHLLCLPVPAILQRQTGEYLSRFSDAGAIRSAISTATLTLFLDSLMVVACGEILYLQNRTMFFVALLMVIFYAIVVLIYKKPTEIANRSVMENNATVQSYLKESIDGIETIKAACADEQAKETTARKFEKYIDVVVKSSLLSMSQETVAGTVEMVGTVIILWIGFSLVRAGRLTLGSLMTFYALLAYFVEPIKNLIELQPTIQTAIVAADRLNDILEMQEEFKTDVSNGEMPLGTVWAFENVDFRYGNRELTLKDISLHINRGEKVAIVGESGSGKTTLARLLIRFYEPESGQITVNEKNIREIKLSDLRNSVSYVSQETFLFSDTIRNNLKLGCGTVTDEEMIQACKLSSADDFIETLPLKYDTPLDEGGANLSGGQKQRLALARALLKKPQLLILDEATSNLDTITESAIKNTVFGFDRDLTCLIIAHRLTTIKGCDHIYVMEQGRIVEQGTHEELMQRNGCYAKLWKSQ